MKDAAIELLGIGCYLLVLQHCLAAYVFEKPEESWLVIGWRWARTRRQAWWDADVGSTFNQSASAPEPKPEPRPE